MKAVRLLQILLVLAAAVYLYMLHDMNPALVALPFLPSVRPAVLVLVSLLIGWLLGFVPPALRALRRRREIRRLRRRVAELEAATGLTSDYPVLEGETPVIPDRDPSPVEGGPYTGQEHT